MLKMGYQSGKPLGKGSSDEGVDESAAPARKKAHLEPIPIVIKQDRKGLGVRTARSAQQAQSTKEQRDKFDKFVQETYLDKKRANFRLRKLLHNLHKCQRICYQLDTTRDVTKPDIIVIQWAPVIQNHNFLSIMLFTLK